MGPAVGKIPPSHIERFFKSPGVMLGVTCLDSHTTVAHTKSINIQFHSQNAARVFSFKHNQVLIHMDGFLTLCAIYVPKFNPSLPRRGTKGSYGIRKVIRRNDNLQHSIR